MAGGGPRGHRPARQLRPATNPRANSGGGAGRSPGTLRVLAAPRDNDNPV